MHPHTIITKNYLVTRDIDQLQRLAEVNAVKVTVSLTSLDKSITSTMEPRTSRPAKRLKAIEELTRAGISVHINLAPLIPGITDDAKVRLLSAAADTGEIST